MTLGVMPADAGSGGGLLAQTAQTVMQMADIAREHDADFDNKLFYYHLAAICLRIQCCLACLDERATQARGELIQQTVERLGFLFANASPLEEQLENINSSWLQIRQQDAEAKRVFVAQWLRPSAERQTIEATLQACADAFEKQQSDPEDIAPVNPSKPSNIGEPAYEIHKAAQSTFAALLNSCKCACPGQHDFSAQLQLGSYRRPNIETEKRVPSQSQQRPAQCDLETGDVDLGMFLSMDQDLRAVRVQAANDKTVSFAVQDDSPPKKRQRVVEKIDSKRIESLCKPISTTKRNMQKRLVLKLTKGTLFDMGFERSTFPIDANVEPMALSEYLEEGHGCFSERTKRILSLLLGYAVIHLQGTPWLPSGWSSENIKFFQTTKSKTPLRPFIQTQLPSMDPSDPSDISLAIHSDDAEANSHDKCGDIGQRHCCPALISLAAVLMEVYYAKPFKRLAEEHGVDLFGDADGPISQLDVELLYHGDEESSLRGVVKDMPPRSPLSEAIKNCLDISLWRDEIGQPWDSAQLRTKIYDKVVSLLECDLSFAFQDVPLDNIDQYAQSLDFTNWGHDMTDKRAYRRSNRLASATRRSASPATSTVSLERTTQAYGHIGYFGPGTTIPGVTLYPLFRNVIPHLLPEHTPSPIAAPDYRTSQFFDDEVDSHDVSVAETKKYRTWKAEYIKVYEQFIPRTTIQHVKIAILDTGIDRNHIRLDNCDDRIKGKRNFHDSSNKKSVADWNGHGTFTANLILDYAPDAELYVIKITGKENTIPDGHIVAEAIRFATDEWGVDIISMSFGWPSTEFDGFQAVQSAIDHAYDKKVLMFAAASNSGGRLGRAYPSSSSEVICVHSTNTNGSRSDFSPTAEPNTINIATVGQSIEAAWPIALCSGEIVQNEDYVVSRSGTSYATPIMAGISAFLLQYARTHLSEAEALSLKRKSTMEALLKRCAQRGPNYKPRDDYFCVQLSLHKHNLFGQGLEWANHEIKTVLRK